MMNIQGTLFETPTPQLLIRGVRHSTLLNSKLWQK